MTLTDPAFRFVAYSCVPSRLGYSPCAPAPVGMNASSVIVAGSITETPPPFFTWFAT